MKKILLGPFSIGCTATYSGIFQIFAGLTALAQWAANDFRTWVDQREIKLRSASRAFIILHYTFTVTQSYPAPSK